MSLDQTSAPVEYPESDGQPMGETDLHIQWLIWLRDVLKWRYRGQQFYVANDLLLYYREGDPAKFVVPDCFVVKDCDPGPRRVFKVWEEGQIPNAVIEITSASSRTQDTVVKHQLYATLGIREYFLFDPTGDYLDPALCGYRLTGDSAYAPIEADSHGSFECQELGVSLQLEDAQLVMTDLQTGKRLLTGRQAAEAQWEEDRAARQAAEAEKEEERAARQAAEAEKEDERTARQAADSRATAAEAERERERAARKAAEAELDRLRQRINQQERE